MNKRSAQEFAEAVKSLGISEWIVNECSICGYDLKFLFRGDKVFYDSGCYCVAGGPDIQPRTYEGVAHHYNIQTNPKLIANMDAVFGFQPRLNPA